MYHSIARVIWGQVLSIVTWEILNQRRGGRLLSDAKPANQWATEDLKMFKKETFKFSGTVI